MTSLAIFGIFPGLNPRTYRIRKWAAQPKKNGHTVSVGDRHGHLTVVEPRVDFEGLRGYGVRCECDCGAVCVKRRNCVVRDKVKACGYRCPLLIAERSEAMRQARAHGHLSRAASLQHEPCNRPDSKGAIPRQASEAAE